MHNIYDCVDSFNELLHIQYKIIIGRKGETRTLYITFQKSDCFHLMGLQYLKDREELNKDREKIFDAIKNRKIDVKHIETSFFYSCIQERIEMLPMLESLFDSNDTIFRYNSKQNKFSMIQADYMMKNTMQEKNIFVFLSENEQAQYFCRSFFIQGRVDYAQGQSKWTLLYKEKSNTNTGNKEILYDRISKASL